MKLGFIALAFLFLLASCGDQSSDKDADTNSVIANSSGLDYQSEDSVRATFDKYKSAILNDKGDVAVKCVDSRTIEYYSKILELVKNADSVEVESLSLLDKFMVLAIRHKTSKEDILSFDGNGLLIYAINSGMVGKSSVANASVGDVTIVDEFAKGEYINNGQGTSIYYHFYYEQGQWKLDLTSIFPTSELAFRQVLTESGNTENEFLLSLLEMNSGKEPEPKIWNPVQ